MIVPADPTLRAIRRAVIEEPGEDAHRLAFADWHEEFGDPGKAAFVRAMVLCAREKGDDEGRLRRRRLRLIWPAFVWLYHHNKGLFRYRRVTFGSPPDSPADWACRLRVFESPIGLWWDEYRRGFVERVSTTLSAFERSAAELFSSHPVAAVSLPDKMPWVGANSRMGANDCFGWHRSRTDGLAAHHQSSLPPWLWDLLQDVQPPSVLVAPESPYSEGPWTWYESAKGALDALSSALVAHGRSLAKLPE